MRKKWFETKSSVLKKIGCLALAAVVAGTGVVTYQNSVKSDIPELVVFTDLADITAAEDEVPLASGTKTTRKVTTKTSTKKTKMKKKAKKSATTTKKSTKQKNSTKKSNSKQVKTNTKVATTIKTKTKKNSNIKTTQTKVVTTVTTTTTALNTAAPAAAPAATTANTAAAGSYNIRSVAAKADGRVLSAFESIGGKVIVNPGVAYSGRFDAADRSITMKTLDATIYHELGHFVEFVGGTSDVKAKIAAAYNSEKSLYTAYNQAYVLQNSSEYFAESFKNYCENAAALASARPATYEAITAALNNITDARVNLLKNVYASVWQ